MGRVRVRPVAPGEEARWDELMAAHHYLGFRRLVGESLKYVAEGGEGWLALVGWATAALKCGPRDRWIGWAPEQQWRRLRYVVNNARFLVLPEARRPNLASRVLAANEWRLWQDWERIFGHPVLLLETFVDARFWGTCYRAAGWEALGRSLGYGRNGGRYYFHGAERTIWVRPLHRRSREWLAAPFDAPVLRRGGGPRMDLNSIVDSEGEFLELLAGVPDRRKRRGIRHSQASVLAVAICAVLSGARSLVAIGEWAQSLPQDALKRLGCRFHPVLRRYQPPSESTIRRELQGIDADEADRRLGPWLEGKGPGEAVAVDGKSLKGSADGEGHRVYLLGALLHKEGVVIGQRRVEEKRNEIAEFKPLLEPMDLGGKVVTADAMHTQREHARYLVEEKGADYLFTVKGNQPGLEADLRAMDDDFFSPPTSSVGKGHGRIEERTVWTTTALNDYLDFPHVGQAFRIEREATRLHRNGGETQHHEVVYGVTSLGPERADSRRIGELARGHWEIENRAHWVRDVTFDEDRSQIRTGSGPRVFACLRNFAIGCLRLARCTNIASGLRHCAWNWQRAFALLGI